LPDASASGEDKGLPRGTVTFLFTDIEGSTWSTVPREIATIR